MTSYQQRVADEIERAWQDGEISSPSSSAIASHASRYNLAPMWYKALPFLNSTSELDGRKCKDLLPALATGLLDAATNSGEYRELNPANGWGDYEGFYEIFGKFVALCHQYPSGTVRWNG